MRCGKCRTDSARRRKRVTPGGVRYSLYRASAAQGFLCGCSHIDAIALDGKASNCAVSCESRGRSGRNYLTLKHYTGLANSVTDLLTCSLNTREISIKYRSWIQHFSSACGLWKSSGADSSVATSTPTRKSALGTPGTRAHVSHSLRCAQEWVPTSTPTRAKTKNRACRGPRFITRARHARSE